MILRRYRAQRARGTYSCSKGIAPQELGPWRNTDHCQSYDQAGREQDKQNPGGSQRKVRWREDEVSGGHIPGTKQDRGG